jgi:MoaA/NifB/PqqE/SkfB family radical SAM enzyme
MCYFSAEKNPTQKGIAKEEDLDLYAKALFKNALNLQIGCGAEPTLYKNLEKIISLGKKYKIPYISLTTNANLLTEEKIKSFSGAGLTEFIVSLHGVHKTSYEFFMKDASFEKFLNNLQLISEEKKRNPNLKLRINYTFNQDNFEELKDFFTVFKNISIDVLQLRPIRRLGDSEYQNFDLSSLENQYSLLLKNIKAEAKNKGITLLCNEQLNPKPTRRNANQSYLAAYTYCYVSPKNCWRKDFDFRTETFAQWSKKTRWKRLIFRNIFKSEKEIQKEQKAGMLNYSVEFN